VTQPYHHLGDQLRDGEHDGGWSLQVEVSDNPITDVLYGPDGAVLKVWRERPPVGFCK